MSPHQSSTFDSLALLNLDQILGHSVLIQSEAVQTRVFAFCTNSPGHFLWVLHLETVELVTSCIVVLNVISL